MTTTTTPEVQAYAAAVRAALADLPAAVVAELLDGLEPHLQEVVAEGTGSLLDALGPPDRYAAELRASAGIHQPLALDAPSAPPDLATTPPPDDTSAPRPVRQRDLGRALHERWGLAVVALLAAGVVVAAARSDQLAFGEIVLPVVLIGAGCTIAVALLGRRVPERWRDPATVVLLLVALTAAVVVGAELADDPVDEVATASGPSTVIPNVPVPDVVGLPIQDAAAPLEAAGMVPVSDDAGQLGQVVVEQDPPAGSFVPQGTLVSLVYGAPETTTTMPPLPPVESTAVEPTTIVPPAG